MAIGHGKRLALLAILAIAAGAGPSTAAAAQPGVSASVWTVPARGASAASSVTVLAVNDQMRIDNRISAHIGPTGRLVLTAPEGLGDPDGDGPNCGLDNARPGESSAQQVSCAPGYIGAIVGDLNGGNDTFDAEPGIRVAVGAVIDGERRPLAGGPGRDRLLGGAAPDLFDGGGGPDSIVGGGDQDVLVGGPGADKVNGGTGRDLCRGGGGIDAAKSCEIARGIP
jgi:RTX calcium-binding nonapeptide repeat (4 copies)